MDVATKSGKAVSSTAKESVHALTPVSVTKLDSLTIHLNVKAVLGIVFANFDSIEGDSIFTNDDNPAARLDFRGFLPTTSDSDAEGIRPHGDIAPTR